jgi:hypothetical protein
VRPGRCWLRARHRCAALLVLVLISVLLAIHVALYLTKILAIGRSLWLQIDVFVGIIALRNAWSFAFTPVAGVQSCAVSNATAAVAVCVCLVFLVETSSIFPFSFTLPWMSLLE